MNEYLKNLESISMEDCLKCRGKNILILKLFATPNWWWCQDCDSVFDNQLQYRGKRDELEQNGILEQVELKNINDYNF